MQIEELVRKHRIADCMRCGNECAAACPVYQQYGTWHPQHLATLVLDGGLDAARQHRLLWGCVTCAACTHACPFDVPFGDFIRDLRVGLDGYEPVLEGIVHRYQRMQANLPSEPRAEGAGKAKTRHVPRETGVQDRLFWVDDSLSVSSSGGIVLFTGCLPLFEAAFGETCGMRPLEMARSAVRMLNRLGIDPVLLEDERCCGRDLYDIGERDTFEKLARHNASLLGSGAETVLTICPECAYTLRVTYRDTVGDVPYEVRHISEFIADRIGDLDFIEGSERFTFHDPCYLCRYMGIEKAPRTILAALSEYDPVEMPRSGRDAPCCGAGSWIDHGPHTRGAVDRRLVEAHETGADTLVTACPKCLVLFHEINPECSWKQSPVVVRDLLTIAASRIAGPTAGKTSGRPQSRR